jgi:kelch-like protein 20/kelch-like protein 24/35
MERQMDETNCVGIHCFAEAHSCQTLEKRSMEYILANFKTVYQQVLLYRICVCYHVGVCQL